MTYSQVFDEYHVTGIETGKQKTEQVTPADGTEVVFSIGNRATSGYYDGEYKTIYPPEVVTTTKNGKVMFSDELQSKILASILTLTNREIKEIKESHVRILNCSFRMDFTSFNFVKLKIEEFTELIKTIPKNSINTPAEFETFAERVVSLKTRAQYPFQLFLLRQEITKTGNELSGKIRQEKKLITDVIPEFFIEGELNDTLDLGNAIVYQIWGVAIPTEANSGNHNVLNVEGFRTQKSNLWVIMQKDSNMKTIRRYASSIVITGGVYYISRDYGKNAYGQQVPIFNYCNNMSRVPNIGNKKQLLDTLNAQLATMSEISKKYLTELN